MRLDIEDMVEAMQMASAYELSSPSPFKRKGALDPPDFKRKLGITDFPETIEGDKELKHELKRLKQQLYACSGKRMCPPKVVFLL